MNDEELKLQLLERMANDDDGHLAGLGLSSEEEHAAEWLEDEGLAEWVEEHPFYGYRITVEGHDRLAQAVGETPGSKSPRC